MKNATKLRFGVILVAAVWVAVANAPVRGEDEERRFLEGLLSRQLYRLAEAHVLAEQQRGEPGERKQAELAAALSHVYTQAARAAAPENRDSLWQKARAATAKFAADHPESDYLPLVRRQEAVVDLVRGKLLRQQSEVVTQGEPLLKEARQALLTASERLRELEVQLEKLINDRSRRPPEEKDKLDAAELRRLRDDVRRQWGEVLVNQGLCYPAGSPDRTNALLLARQQHRSVAEIDDPVDWESRLEVGACDRMLGEFQKAEIAIDAVLARRPNLLIEALARLELARLELDRGNIDEALAELAKVKPVPGAVAARDYERLVILLAGWEKAGDKPNAKIWRDQAVAAVKQIEEDHGGYWMRRAEALLGRRLSIAPATDDIAILIRAAAGFFRSGEFDEALATYDRAAVQAKEQGDAARIFDLGYAAAAIEHDRGRHAEAQQRFHKLALSQPRNNRASAAHLMSVFHAGQIARGKNPPRLDDYLELLEEHLENWPDDPTTPQAHFWLAQVLEARRQWPEAAGHYRGVRTEHELFDRAVAGAARCYANWLAELKPADENRKSIAAEAAEFFERLLPGEGGELPAKLDSRRMLAAVTSARLRLRYDTRRHRDVERRLVETLQHSDEETDAWRTKAKVLLVLALVGQEGRLADADAAWKEVQGAEAKDLFDLLTGLEELAGADQQRQRELAGLRLAVAERLNKQPDQLNAAELRRVRTVQAEALAATGDLDDALDAYAALAKNHPDDGDVQTDYARLLLARQDKASLRQALTKWREVEKRTRTGSDHWFEAKYSQALAQERLGNPAQAVKIVTLTRALHPELGDSSLRRRFLELLERCEKSQM